MNYRDLDKRNQHLTTQNNQREHHLDMLNARHQAMNDMVRNDTRILFAGLRCALKDMNIELSAEIKYQRMPEVGIDPDTVDQGALTHAYQGGVSGIDHHIRKASAPIKKDKHSNKYDTRLSAYLMKRGDKNLISMINRLRTIITLLTALIK